MPKLNAGEDPRSEHRSKSFDDVFRAELAEICERHNKASATKLPSDSTMLEPSMTLGLTGLACSGGGIRSAAFCLGVLQGLESKEVLKHVDYLSTVSGGGYVGTTMTIGMSSNPEGAFPFGRLDEERRETPEVRHLRDNSRYLLQSGLPSAISAAVIYLRGIATNVLVLLPLLLIASALLVSLNPSTKALTTNHLAELTGLFSDKTTPFTIAVAWLIAGLLFGYALVVSILPIAQREERQRGARVAGGILFVAIVVVLVELHSVLLRHVFEALGYIQYHEPASLPDSSSVLKGAEVLGFIYGSARAFVLLVAPLVLVVLPFLKNLAAKAVEGNVGGWGDLAQRVASRFVLLFAALVVPMLLWLAVIQLAYWGTAVSTCPGNMYILDCDEQAVASSWRHAPAMLEWLFGRWPGSSPWAGPIIYFLIALGMLALWPFLSVNANSLHQLYRDRLGNAFLIRRRKSSSPAEAVDLVDDFKLTDIDPRRAPYHLINTALNVPGSRFANRRGRNADFFVFSRRFIGSEATGYVETEKAEKVVDGLNIGTAMAISGAAAAPNMGMASIRPLSPAIAFLNIRLGRWVRHPRAIARHFAHLHRKRAKRRGTKSDSAGESYLQRIPGPVYLLYEAFSKSGLRVADVESRHRGFVFLTDGGHVDNLGIYELLRRRCRLIIAIDAEADPYIGAASLVQVERFARIDFNVIIRLQWPPIGERTRAVSEEMRKGTVKAENGPHVALGVIDYPPAPAGTGEREKGVLVYIKASLSGDENDYILAYKATHPRFPHETTADQLFSEEQFEVYRALGEHISRRFLDGSDKVAAFAEDRAQLLETVRSIMPLRHLEKSGQTQSDQTQVDKIGT